MSSAAAIEEGVQRVNAALIDHPMWIDDAGQPLNYSPEREARISDFIEQVRNEMWGVFRDMARQRDEAWNELAKVRQELQALKVAKALNRVQVPPRDPHHGGSRFRFRNG